MAQPSRLLQYERRRALRTALVYLALTAAFLFALTRFGTAIITSMLGVVDRDPQNLNTNDVIVATPDIDALPQVTNSKIIILSGSSVPGQTVRLALNGESRDIVANSTGKFTSEFNLHEGENRARVMAVDNHGNTSNEITGVVVLDTEPPSLEVTSPEDNSTQSGKKNQSVTISGTTDKDASVSVNERIAIVNNAGQFSISFNLNPGENIFTVIAVDPAGNKAEVVKKTNYNE